MTMSKNKTVTATFTLTYTLTVNESGTGSGTVMSSPTGINCQSAYCSASFPSGTQVTLTATPNSGYIFTGWSGVCTGTGTCTLTMNQNQNVTATFQPAPCQPQPLPSGVTVIYPGPTGCIWPNSVVVTTADQTCRLQETSGWFGVEDLTSPWPYPGWYPAQCPGGASSWYLALQSDGNFVFYCDSKAVWATGTQGNSGAFLGLVHLAGQWCVLEVWSSSNSLLWISPYNPY